MSLRLLVQLSLCLALIIKINDAEKPILRGGPKTILKEVDDDLENQLAALLDALAPPKSQYADDTQDDYRNGFKQNDLTELKLKVLSLLLLDADKTSRESSSSEDSEETNERELEEGGTSPAFGLSLLNTLRGSMWKSCGKKAAKYCKKACREAVSSACRSYSCGRKLKSKLKSNCKSCCNHRFES